MVHCGSIPNPKQLGDPLDYRPLKVFHGCCRRTCCLTNRSLLKDSTAGHLLTAHRWVTGGQQTISPLGLHLSALGTVIRCPLVDQWLEHFPLNLRSLTRHYRSSSLLCHRAYHERWLGDEHRLSDLSSSTSGKTHEKPSVIQTRC